MSSHADTIRDYLATVARNSDADSSLAALDALLAENQQLREALREIIGVKHDPNRVATELQDLARAALAAVGEE